ncbi:MAG: PQQ-binding-like beta-propeller repeat protein [Gammaproteobacteria bacterium]|nr:PQQ-binding-like beta-propeller repeat protein [Gammaproteobacteria bacterium]
MAASCLRLSHHRSTVCVLLAACGLVAAAENGSGGAISRAPAFSAKELVAPPVAGWLTNGGTIFNQRYSPLARIDRNNVKDLKALWRTHLNGSGVASHFSGEAQPIVHDGVIYLSTGANDVFALSVATGDIIWSHAAALDPAIDSLCCGWISRGVALGDGKVFMGRLDGRVVALDQQSGKELWSVQAERWQEGFSITAAPLYYDGMVVVGLSGGEYGVRGRVKAYRAADGAPLWTFYTVPGPGEPGHETWPSDNETWKKGGGTVWQTPAVDPALGLIYFSTGNAAPDFNGAVRRGDNLYTASIVAIDAATGKYRWHYQQVHHDLWDYDSANPVVLFDAPIAGAPRQAIAQVSKTGWVYILDRVTGKPLLGIDERPVVQEARQATALTQPYPVGDPIVPQAVDIPPEGFGLVNQGRIFTPFFGTEGTIIAPSLFGGANWPPSAFDPKRRQLFVCASHVLGNFVGGDRDFEPAAPGKQYFGGVVGFADLPRTGIFAAVDLTTNRLVWRQRWKEQCYSGITATAGDLLFVGRNDGRLTALDSDTGRTLWEFQTGAGVNAPASVFEYQGKQYVVVLSAGNLLGRSAHGDSVWLFALDGTLGPVSADTATQAGGFTLPGGTPDLAVGRTLYQQSCLPCHGADGEGGHGGGKSLHVVTDQNAAAQVVANGRGAMPALGAALTPQQIRDVTAYVVTEVAR